MGRQLDFKAMLGYPSAIFIDRVALVKQGDNALGSVRLSVHPSIHPSVCLHFDP